MWRVFTIVIWQLKVIHVLQIANLKEGRKGGRRKGKGEGGRQVYRQGGRERSEEK